MPKLIENVREKLIIEGREVLLEKSYKELNIREIAKRVGIASGTFYNYFSGKEELVSEIFRDDWKNTLNLMDELKNSNEHLKEKLRKLYESLQGFLDRYVSIFYEIANTRSYDYSPGGNIPEQNQFKLLYEKLENVLLLEKERGNITSTLALNKLAVFIVANLSYLSKNKYMSFEELYESMKL